ncbi:hypothetical protein Esti_001867 [Eimeria stiedai]
MTMALPWRIDSRMKRATGISCRSLLVQALLFFCLPILQELAHQRWSTAFAVEEALASEAANGAHIAKGEGLAGVTPADVSPLAPTSSNEGSVSERKWRNSHRQQQLGREPEQRWFLGASNKNLGDHDLPHTGQDWIPHDLASELAADSNAAVKRPFDLLRRAAALFGKSPWLVTMDGDAANELSGASQGHALAAVLGLTLASMFPQSNPTQRDGAHESLRLVGTWATNSLELLLADFGAGAYGLTVVPMHPDMNMRRFLEVMIHTQMTHLCTDWRHLEVVLDLVEKGQLPNLSTIISLDAIGVPAMLRARSLNLALHEFWDLLDPSRRVSTQQEHNVAPSGPLSFGSGDIHAVLYPRALSMPFNGTMLSNENIVASLDTLTDYRVGAIAIIEEDRILFAESLASFHQRVMSLAVLRVGATASFTRSGLLSLHEDVSIVNPTVVSAPVCLLPLLHAAARRTLKRMGRLRRIILMLKLRWRARSYWHTDDMELLARPPIQELKKLLASVHTLFVAPALASSELIKEVQLLYSVIVVHACCSPETGTAFSTRQQRGNLTDPSSFRRVRAAPLGWASSSLRLTFEKLSASDEAGLVEFHADGASGGRGGLAQLILDPAHAPSDRLHSTVAADDYDEFRPTVFSKRKQHAVTEGEIVIQGACVSVGYYRHQTAFQRNLTTRGMYKTGLVATSCGADFPLLLISTLPRTVLTSVGEFIDLEEAEKKIRKVPIVRRVMLYADDFNSPLVAIIEPRRNSVIRWARRRFAYSDDYGASYENLMFLPALRDFVLKQIEGYTWLTLEAFERPKSIYLVPHKLTLPLGQYDKDLGHKHNGRSISRQQLAEAYAKPIREMYASISE